MHPMTPRSQPLLMLIADVKKDTLGNVLCALLFNSDVHDILRDKKKPRSNAKTTEGENTMY